ncbi:glycosyltransferase 87 family protein [Corynebacterium uberis]|uniref:glycosyltransferase family 87 protein n=1 Tax=Corynebacterium TaxID=1716 RepID=UPI001D0AA99B|nr:MULTISPECIES: glycosyltransferase family 87 protein [Corynebacterium]MCZ9309100.1 glycosyltransferase 87 family protein [Corynebacterium sp. c6VSa_13]UDL74434.1 glycosyltransferase 87 family protein [Corynebacterium uberis]UDL78944.1 glycosyltransferase 87 family protein [Corynebacterium uberis]UDL81222.1 glycosyltransferase 87 family protein [Corynebacterium uberis]UDL83359.1 glycosyltransferase 87 family protein [Corynebacterium uberis]
MPTYLRASAPRPRSAASHPAYLLITLVGLAIGVSTTVAHIAATDLPVDMAIYREGVWAFFDGREVYGQRMRAGDAELPFIYPPFGALALAPFSWKALTHDDAGNAMILLSDALLLLCIFLVLRQVITAQEWLAPLTTISWAAALHFRPVVINDNFAQINVVIMTLVVLDLIPRRRRLPQGWLIGLAAAIKVTPLAMLLFFVVGPGPWRQRLRPVVTAIVTAVVATAASASVRWDMTKEYFGSTLLGMGSGSELAVDDTYTSNSSLKAMIMRSMPTRGDLETHQLLVSVLWLVCSLLVIALGAWIMYRLRHTQRDTQAWLVGAVVMLLISPVSWSHHWVWLALLLPVAWWHACQHPQRTFLVVCTVLWTTMVLTSPPKWWFGDGIDFDSLDYWQRFLVSDFVWVALATLIGLAWQLRLMQRVNAGAEDPGGDESGDAQDHENPGASQRAARPTA